MNQKGFANVILLGVVVLLLGAGAYFSLSSDKSIVPQSPENPIVNPSISTPTPIPANPSPAPVPNPQPTPVPTPTPIAPSNLIAEQKSPAGGNKLLKDTVCLTASGADQYTWGVYLASRSHLIKSGYSAAYFDAHFCPLDIRLDGYDQKSNTKYARVTLKGLFSPYLAYWQHHFPVLLDASGQVKLENGSALIDYSKTHYLVPEFKVSEIRNLLSPQQLYAKMEALIGKFEGPVQVYLGPAIGKMQVRLYGVAKNLNPNSKYCGDTDRIGTIDVETGVGEVTYNGACF